MSAEGVVVADTKTLKCPKQTRAEKSCWIALMPA
jgi:hypothetical protein